MDIQAEWTNLMGGNALTIIGWTTDFMKQYWRIAEDEKPQDWIQRLNAYRKDAMSGNYDHVIDASAEFIREQTGIELDCTYLAERCLDREYDDDDD